MPTLSQSEAAQVAASVLNPPSELRRSCWHVSESLGTIGEPLYRNRDRWAYYCDCAHATNRMLATAYSNLYDRVVAIFEERYHVPVVFVEELAIPGFHLVAYTSPGWHDGGGWHLDQLAWQVPYFSACADEVAGIVNFTLPLVVPSGGTGMDLIDGLAAATADHVSVHVPYQPGVMVLSECEILHRLGPSTSTRAGEVRLTHQGHGVLFRGRLLLFW